MLRAKLFPPCILWRTLQVRKAKALKKLHICKSCTPPKFYRSDGARPLQQQQQLLGARQKRSEAVYNGHAVSGLCTGYHLHWHILPLIQDKRVLVRSDNMPTVAYINHQRGVRSCLMSQLACCLLLWSLQRVKFLPYPRSSTVRRRRSHGKRRYR